MHTGVRALARPRQIERHGPVHPVVLPAGGPRGARLRPLRGQGLQQGDRAHARRQMPGNHEVRKTNCYRTAEVGKISYIQGDISVLKKVFVDLKL